MTINGLGIPFWGIVGSTHCGADRGKVNGVILGCVEGTWVLRLGWPIFTGSKASWEIIPEGVPQFEKRLPAPEIPSK